MRGCRRAADVVEILDRNRHAVQRRVVAGGEATIGLACLLPRFVRHDQDEGVQSRVVASIRCRHSSVTRGSHFARTGFRAEFLDRHLDSWPGFASDDALTLKSAARTAATDFASPRAAVSIRAEPRRSASATALQPASIVIVFTRSPSP
jgi:hypothetical protein